jgi:hypothetical protein
LRDDANGLYSPAFSLDGKWLVVGSNDGIAWIWDLCLQNLIDLACRTAGRNLSWREWQQYFSQATYRTTCPNLPLHPSYAAHVLDDAVAAAQQGKIAAAIAAFHSVQQLSSDYTISATYSNPLCRAGVLWDHMRDVLEFCGRALASAPDSGETHDNRGLVRALIGDLPGAIEDFQSYIAWAEREDRVYYADEIVDRNAWITTLQAGRQPFDDAMLRRLRAAELKVTTKNEP